MAWRLARSLDDLRKQVNNAAPNRSKASDGTIGDAAHSSRTSDHNPDGSGIVRALDITHDPKNGVDSQKLADAVLASRDPRLRYVISNGKIASGASGSMPWVWRKYNGVNPHSKHVHFSVVAGAAGDRAGSWDIAIGSPDADAPDVQDWPLLRKGAKGHAVMLLQQALTKGGFPLSQDGDFGPKTEAAVKKFQKSRKLVADGIVGPYSWSALIA